MLVINSNGAPRAAEDGVLRFVLSLRSGLHSVHHLTSRHLVYY